MSVTTVNSREPFHRIVSHTGQQDPSSDFPQLSSRLGAAAQRGNYEEVVAILEHPNFQAQRKGRIFSDLYIGEVKVKDSSFVAFISYTAAVISNAATENVNNSNLLNNYERILIAIVSNQNIVNITSEMGLSPESSIMLPTGKKHQWGQLWNEVLQDAIHVCWENCVFVLLDSSIARFLSHELQGGLKITTTYHFDSHCLNGSRLALAHHPDRSFQVLLKMASDPRFRILHKTLVAGMLLGCVERNCLVQLATLLTQLKNLCPDGVEYAFYLDDTDILADAINIAKERGREKVVKVLEHWDYGRQNLSESKYRILLLPMTINNYEELVTTALSDDEIAFEKLYMANGGCICCECCQGDSLFHDVLMDAFRISALECNAPVIVRILNHPLREALDRREIMSCLQEGVDTATAESSLSLVDQLIDLPPLVAWVKSFLLGLVLIKAVRGDDPSIVERVMTHAKFQEIPGELLGVILTLFAEKGEKQRVETLLSHPHFPQVPRRVLHAIVAGASPNRQDIADLIRACPQYQSCCVSM